MNSVRRSRKHPRVKSCSFVSFGWLVTREAAFHIVYPFVPGSLEEATARRAIAEAVTYNIRRVAESLLRFYPERRWYFGSPRPPTPDDPAPVGHALARAER